MNKKLKIQIGTVSAALILILAVFLFIRQKRNPAHDLPTVLKSGRLAVLTDSSMLGFAKSGDSIYGFQYEIIKAFADTLGVELVITEQSDMKACMESLAKGDYDIIANFAPITTEWQNEALFTNSFHTSRQVLVQRYTNDSAQTKLINNQLDLANDSIYLPLNSPYKMRIQHLANEIADTIHVLEMKDMSPEQLVHWVANGKIKYTICDEEFAKRLKLMYKNIDISLPVSFDQQQAWIVHRKSPKLLAELNDFLGDFIGSSAYWKIYRKYYN